MQLKIKIRFIILLMSIGLSSCLSYPPPVYPEIQEGKSYILFNAQDLDRDATQHKIYIRYSEGIKIFLQEENTKKEFTIDFRYDEIPQLLEIKPGKWNILGYGLPCEGFSSKMIPLEKTTESEGSFLIETEGIYYIGHFFGKNRVGNSNNMNDFRTKEITIKSDLTGLIEINNEIQYLPLTLKIKDISLEAQHE